MDCPPEPEETAEAYLLGHLDPPEATRFREHCETCEKCSRILQETRDYIEAMKRSAKELEDEGRRTDGSGSES